MSEKYGGREKEEKEVQLVPRLLRHWLVGRLLVTGLAVGCYANSCWGEFVFDDSEAVVGNEDVDPEASSWREVFSHDFWGENISSRTSHKSYRPLTVFSFRFNFWMAGGIRDPFYYHLTNVLLHPLVCLLLLEVFSKWFRQLKTIYKSSCELEGVPFVASLLFAVHPLHTETVSGVVGRAELGSAILFLSSILLYQSLIDHQRGVAVEALKLSGSIALAGLAMLFKEQGITALGICIVSDFVFSMRKHRDIQCWENWMKLWRHFLCRVTVLCVGGAGIVWCRFAVMATGVLQFKPIDNPAAFSESWLTRLLSFNYIYSLNWWLMFSPWWLCFDWSMGCVPLLHHLKDPRVAAVIVFWVLLTSLSVWALYKLQTREGCLVVLSLSLLVLPFLPASNLFFVVGFVVAERVLYISSAGHCLLVAMGTSSLATHSSLLKRVMQFFLVFLTIFHSLRSIHRSSQWLTEEELFISGLHVCPLNAKVHYNVGKILTDTGQAARGEAAYKEAIRLYPEYDQALNNLANLVKEFNRLEEAEMYLERALTYNKEFAAAWMNLGIVQAALNKTKAAEESYRKAITSRRKYPDAYYNLGNLYIDLGLASEAIAAFCKAISQDRLHVNAWTNLGLLYEDLHMYKEAEEVMREALVLMPNKPRFHFSLGVLLGKTKRLKEGEKYLSEAVTMRPNLAKYHVNLGVIYHLQGRYELADSCYRTALQLEPGLSSAEDNLRKLKSKLTKRN